MAAKDYLFNLNTSKMPFMSLQTKAILMTTLLFFIIFSINISYGIFKSENKFYEKQKTLISNVDKEIQQTLESERQSLNTYTSFLNSQIENKLNSDSPFEHLVFIENTLEEYLWELEIDYDINSITFSQQGRNIKVGSQSPPESLIKSATQSQSPQWLIDCQSVCSLFLSVPYLSEDKKVKVISISKPLTQTLLQLNNKFSSDVMLLQQDIDNNAVIKGQALSSPDRIAEKIAQWNINSILDNLENQYFLTKETINQTKAISAHSIPRAQQKLKFLVINDITATKTAQRNIIFNNIFLGLIALIFIEMVIIMIMWPPLQSLKKLSASLPLMAESKYDEAKKRINHSIQKTKNSLKIFHDETDQLNHSMYQVCQSLQEYSEELYYRNEELSNLAHNDILTGLSNRRHFKEELEHCLKISKRTQLNGAVLFFDIDNFKDVNDGSGHHVGDNMLIMIANKLKSICRKNDLMARMGGDEFAIVLPDVDEQTALNFGYKIRDSITSIEIPGSKVIHKVSVSIGIVMFPNKEDTYESLIYYSDIAMYKAKELGKNTVYLLKDNDRNSDEIDERVYWAEKVKENNFDDFMSMVYQPIYNFEEQVISHYEALLRIKDQNGDYCSPVNYINAAERTGNIYKMDMWVIRKVCQDLKKLTKEKNCFFSINLSALSFSNENLIQDIESIFNDEDVDATNIIFEITETAALQSFYMTIKKMNEIRNLGCKFALDDFGVGFSSFYNLKKLPIDYVKIDGSFIKNLKTDKGDQTLVQALVYIVQQYGEQTVAEFVEDQETLDILNKLGVNYAQGYYISKPLKLEDIN